MARFPPRPRTPHRQLPGIPHRIGLESNAVFLQNAGELTRSEELRPFQPRSTTKLFVPPHILPSGEWKKQNRDNSTDGHSQSCGRCVAATALPSLRDQAETLCKLCIKCINHLCFQSLTLDMLQAMWDNAAESSVGEEVLTERLSASRDGEHLK